MGQLLTRVREAEERLAGIARALQSAYDEEEREAAAARDSALQNLHRAEAMALAARALGRDELAQRLDDVIGQLKASESDARNRLSELATVQDSLRARLDAPTSAPELLPAPAPPPIVESAPEPRPAEPAPVEPKVAEPKAVEPKAVEPKVETNPVEASAPRPAPAPVAPAPVVESPSAVAPVKAVGSKLAELRQKITGLATRVAEIQKVAARLPAPSLKLALEEHVALARLLAQRIDEADGDGMREVESLLQPLAGVARERGLGNLFGMKAAEFDDWAKVAADAKAKRQALSPAKPKN